MQAKVEKIAAVLLILTIFFLSYARDTSFILLNAAISNEQFNYANTEIPEFFKQLSFAQLKQLKWLMSIGLAGIFMVITTAIIHLYFHNKQFTKLTVMLYLIFGCSALFTEYINYLFKLPTRFSNILHFPQTLIESPLVVLILFSGLFFIETLKSKTR